MHRIEMLFNRLFRRGELEALAARAVNNVRHDKWAMMTRDSEGDLFGDCFIAGIEIERRVGDLRRLRALVVEQETRPTLENQLGRRQAGQIIRSLPDMAREE